MSHQTTITSPRHSFLKPTAATLNVTVRKSVYDLTDPEVVALRQAFAALQAIGDNRGYQYLAGIHGLPQYYCPHGNPLFLIWHRPFVLMFEQALQAVSPGIALPYWDWASDRAQNEGVPQIFADQIDTDPVTGQQVPNPLYQAAISFDNPDGFTQTNRDPGDPAQLADLAVQVRQANRDPDYDTFCPDVESPHNGLHGWVGGSMGVIPYSAFDPIFWAHHCFVEKLFCDWQDRTSASISGSIAGQVLAPFNKMTDDVWNYKVLGYRYAPEGMNMAAPVKFRSLSAAALPSSHAATFNLSKVPDDFERAYLYFTKTRYPLKSFEVRVFFNEAASCAGTKKHGNPNYAGSLYTFGHGGCTGDPGHCDVPEVPESASHFIMLRPEHHLTPKRRKLDVSKALRYAKQNSKSDELEIHIVLVNSKGIELPQEDFDFEMLTLDAV
ncbi:MAG: tyrosinase family protein [Methylococcaceae bacterium]|nr:tyrosinase family protein [Methylococcaceae bacterium]